MKVIKVKEILEKNNLIGRSLAREVVEEVQAGDVLDFEGFLAISNSVADEMVKLLFKKLGKEDFFSLKFINMDPLLEVLVKKSIKKYETNSIYFRNFK